MKTETESPFNRNTNDRVGGVGGDIKQQRHALYFDSDGRKIFGWYHPADPGKAKSAVAVICNPLGYEYTHSYRSLRHLAEELAINGIASLRFDYDATGDSPGDDLAPNRFTHWLQDIRAATSTARALSGCKKVCLLGLRMGATLAAIVASTEDISCLVLWAPCSGKQYVREMKALAQTAADETNKELGFESAGFTLLHETAEQLKTINLLSLPFRAECDVLLLQRDDISFEPTLEQHLRENAINVTQLAVPGYTDMLAEPQFTVVPSVAIDRIVNWLDERFTSFSAPAPFSLANRIIAYTSSETAIRQDGVELIEHYYQFGNQAHLFGIVTMPNASGSPPKSKPQTDNKPAVVLLNSGSVHRVGPNRLYVLLARTLATQGFMCFRLDLQGLGDSFSLEGERENHPYPKSANDDTASALQFLQTQFGCTSYILAGLCSGAHTAFRSCLELSQCNIVEAILINPLTFHYIEGMSLATTQHFQDVEYYKKSARSIKSWLKLIQGKVDLTYLTALAGSQLKIAISTLLQEICERFFPNAAPQLAKDLQALIARKRSLHIFIASGDPGYALLMTGAKYTATQYIKKGKIGIHFIADSNHTFSTRKPRIELIRLLCQHLTSRFSSDTPHTGS